MKKVYKIFVDDYRNPKDKFSCDKGWKIATNFNEFKAKIDKIIQLAEDWIAEISFDYDLRSDKTGLDCFKYLIEVCLKYGLPMPKIHIHSDYPNIMSEFIELSKEFERKTDEIIEIVKIPMFRFNYA